jgi:hypothetical protein
MEQEPQPDAAPALSLMFDTKKFQDKTAFKLTLTY